MIGFFIKKNFCDGWDNMLPLVVPNLITSLVAVAFGFLTYFAGTVNLFLAPLVFIVGSAVTMIFIMAFGDNAARIANFEVAPYANYFKQIPSCIKDGLLFGALCGVILVAATMGIPYYLGLFKVKGMYPAFMESNPMIGQVIAFVLFWLLLIILLALQWFLPLRSLMKGDFKKTLKKCFLILFDNTGFSLFMFLYNLILTVFSVAIFFLFMPSFSGIQLAATNALRLRLYKYDWQEAHPELTTKAELEEVPWKELLAEDKESLGPRTFRSFIFPWKN